MKKISSIYLGNCGYTTAWYDGIILNLVNPETDEPTDTILNLQNGGGKTTLLSLIFSCFETSQDRFLKHLQSKNNHFSDYFSPEGLPGFILVEWRMPPKSGSGKPYYLVVGQAVSVQGREQAQVTRLFFSFESTSGLRLGDVPAPKLTMAPVSNIQEFRQWVHSQQRRDPSFFATEKQSDWHAHLKGECRLDLDLLRMQVNFSAAEGGFDEGFLSFKTEAGFLSKFLGLTLDERRATDLRALVAETCDKLGRKPLYQKALKELAKFQDSLQTFDADAKTLKSMRAAQALTVAQGGATVMALSQRVLKHKIAQEQEAYFAQEQASLAADAAQHAKELRSRTRGLNALQLRRVVVAAQQAYAEADEAHKKAGNAVRFARAALVQAAVIRATATLETLDKDAQAAAEGLLPFKQDAQQKGSLLKLALNQVQDSLRAQLGELTTAWESRREAWSEFKQEGARAQAILSGAGNERAGLATEETLYQVELDRFVDEHYLMEGESLENGVAHWKDMGVGHRNATLEKLTQRQDIRKSVIAIRQQVLTDSQEVTGLDGLILTQRKFIKAGQVQRAALSQDPVLLQAAEAESVDPSSPQLVGLVQQLFAQAEKDVLRADIILADLRTKQIAIADSGVAGRNPDVDLVVDVLQAAGIKSARPFKDYISQTIPDAIRARALVMSDPARFLGVMVAQAELTKVAGVDWDSRKPFLPVQVSVAQLSPEAAREGIFTVVPFTDASYNQEAAQVLAQSLEQDIAQESRRRTTASGMLETSRRAKDALQQYLTNYGEELLLQAQAKLCGLEQDRDAVQMRVSTHNEQVNAQEQLDEGLQAEVLELQQQEFSANQRAIELERLVNGAHACHPARVERMTELSLLIQDEVARKTHAEAEIQRFEAAEIIDGPRMASLNLGLQLNANDDMAVELFDENPLTQQTGDLLDVVTLKGVYKRAEDTLKTNERDRLGFLQIQLQNARDSKQQSQQEFARDYADVSHEQLLPYLQTGNSFLVGDLERTRDSASLTLGMKQSEAQRVQADSSAWISRNQPIPEVTPDEVASDDDEIETMLESLDGQLADATRREEQASAKSKAASDEAVRIQTQSEIDTQLNSSLRQVLDLFDIPDLAILKQDVAKWSATDEVELAPVVLEHDAKPAVDALMATFRSSRNSADASEKVTRKSFGKLQVAATRKEFSETEPEISRQMLANEFDAACLDSTRLKDALNDRIDTMQSGLDDMQADFDTCLGEVNSLVGDGMSLLKSAVSKKVPAGAPYVAGKHVLKMRSQVITSTAEERDRTARQYLDTILETRVIPVKGADIVAEVLQRLVPNRSLGLQVLKMVMDESEQYVAFDKITNSGGEAVVMAMFLYGVISQLRAETQSGLKNSGGPLVLDNPFAKATSPTMWKAQRLLARSMGLQLIFATAIQDFNALGEFDAFIRLRNAGQNSKTKRHHIELMKQTFLAPRPAEVAYE